MKKLFISIFTCVFALFALGTATFAWFTMNDEVSAKGMNVKAKAQGNLVINESAVVPVGSTKMEANFNESTATDLIPVTYNSGWKIVANAQEVDPLTGDPDAATASVLIVENTHYKDYVVYIASNGEALQNQLLQAQVIIPDSDEAAIES